MPNFSRELVVAALLALSYFNETSLASCGSKPKPLQQKIADSDEIFIGKLRRASGASKEGPLNSNSVAFLEVREVFKGTELSKGSEVKVYYFGYRYEKKPKLSKKRNSKKAEIFPGGPEIKVSDFDFNMCRRDVFPTFDYPPEEDGREVLIFARKVDGKRYTSYADGSGVVLGTDVLSEIEQLRSGSVK